MREGYRLPTTWACDAPAWLERGVGDEVHLALVQDYEDGQARSDGADALEAETVVERRGGLLVRGRRRESDTDVYCAGHTPARPKGRSTRRVNQGARQLIESGSVARNCPDLYAYRPQMLHVYQLLLPSRTKAACSPHFAQILVETSGRSWRGTTRRSLGGVGPSSTSQSLAVIATVPPPSVLPLIPKDPPAYT
jgi:hypothetical protein